MRGLSSRMTTEKYPSLRSRLAFDAHPKLLEQGQDETDDASGDRTTAVPCEPRLYHELPSSLRPKHLLHV
jgi:hypothetical protein